MKLLDTNKLHAIHYGEGMGRRFPKKGIVSIGVVSTASGWLRVRMQIEQGKRFMKKPKRK